MDVILLKLQVAGFLDNSLVNGTGFRSVVFVSGCYHNCDECQNKAMQSFNYGESIDINKIFRRILSNIPIIKGVTFSGGEPFEQAEELIYLAKKIKDMGLNLWCYTGYCFEDLTDSDNKNKYELLNYIDVLVDGKFNKNLTQNAPKYAGSSNQRVIDVKKSLKSNCIVSYKLID